MMPKFIEKDDELTMFQTMSGYIKNDDFLYKNRHIFGKMTGNFTTDEDIMKKQKLKGMVQGYD